MRAVRGEQARRLLALSSNQYTRHSLLSTDQAACPTRWTGTALLQYDEATTLLTIAAPIGAANDIDAALHAI